MSLFSLGLKGSVQTSTVTVQLLCSSVLLFNLKVIEPGFQNGVKLQTWAIYILRPSNATIRGVNVFLLVLRYQLNH